MKKLILIPLLYLILAAGARAEVQLDLVELPSGFNIEIYAKGVENARQMVLSKLSIMDEQYLGQLNVNVVEAIHGDA